MSYIGNTNTTQGFIPAIDYFNGDGSTVAFTLSRPVASVAQVQANISNVPQNPSSAFSVSGSTITFTSAPPSGTNNIYVYYTSPITQVIAPSQGTVNTTSLGNITNIASGNSSLTLQTGSTPTTALTIDTSQNVGIGTSSPSGRLAVAATGGAGLIVGQSNDNFYASTNHRFYDLSYANERARIDTSGNLLVGTTSSLIGSTGGGSLTLGIGGVGSNNTGTLALNGSSAANYGATLFGYSNGSYSWAVGSYSNIIGGGSTSTFITIRNSGGGGVYLNGSSATSWTAVSDETRKIIIEPITNAADKVATLRAVIGRLKSDEETVRRPYLIAQDVQNVLPEAVSEAVDEEGPVLGLSYTEVIPLLVAAIQEQQAIITSLTDRITALEGAK